MANWCRGILKIRGTRENLVKFLKEDVICFSREKQSDGKYKSVEIPLLNVKCEEDVIEIEEQQVDASSIKYFLKYLGGRINDVLKHEAYKREDDMYIVAFDFETKWGLRLESFVEFSQTYGLDIKGKFYECGMEFTQEIEVIGGTLVLWKVTKYKDYEWECENPYWGG